MKVMKLAALALAAVVMMVGCDSKTEAPAEVIEQTVTEVTKVIEDAGLDMTEEAEDTETVVITDENETVE